MSRPTTPPFVPLPVQHGPSAPAQGQDSHFTAIGGEQVVGRLVERFYHHMESVPAAALIRAMHPADLSEVEAVLTRYLCEWMGGPTNYSSERGHPRLRMRHLPFSIRAEERDAWMQCMRLALVDVVPDRALRESLERAFARVADALRNQAATPDPRSKA